MDAIEAKNRAGKHDSPLPGSARGDAFGAEFHHAKLAFIDLRWEVYEAEEPLSTRSEAAYTD